ncbi:class I SAM-dependent methyltransferase [Rhizobium sp. BK251]|uniref:class I SAM-dependent methyltransferase n=1 Tax=Rhizobium sp. BK251 TaxID=2512125 RepID=UPI0010EF7397|nr:class I SAM-dependent methyltransferase [Rhizobium sp. BK251]TCL75576.1 methyltransferase family protein [Rhizobium sp. BK251]
MDYNYFHAQKANRHKRVRGRTVLVIGCNTGGDCRYFVDLGAKEVHGVDVVDGIGRDFPHPTVTYHQESAEAMSLPSGYFDLVYSVATMEHVPDIFRAFSEMARVVKPGGVVYSLAAPLWNSRHGHHYPQYFVNYPWAHLRLSRDEAVRYLEENSVAIAEANGTIQDVVAYMLDARNFNMRPSTDYIAATARLPDLKVKVNMLDREPRGAIPPEVLDELAAKGYDEADLRAITHCFIAKKRKPWRLFWVELSNAAVARSPLARQP